MKDKQFNICTRCAGAGKVPRGEYLRELRESSGVSLKDMAKKLGFTQQYISDIELGRRIPTNEIVKGYGL